MAQTEALSIERAWHSVSLEERLELIARSQAQGILAAFALVAFIGAAAYGFDKIWLLAASFVGALMVMPMFSSYSWRRGKPELILKYLSVRSVARRYAYSLSITDLDIILIFQGEMADQFTSEEDKFVQLSARDTEFGDSRTGSRPVWICLLRGGVILLSEKPGGARPEFITQILPDTSVRRAKAEDDAPDGALIISAGGQQKGRQVILWSRYAAALYVFERWLTRLIDETVEAHQKMFAAFKE